MSNTRWWEYVQSHTMGQTNRDIARTVDFDPSALSRWKGGERPRWDFVVKFARAYNRNVVEALAAAEFITDAEANLRDVNAGLGDFTTRALLEEALRRVD